MSILSDGWGCDLTCANGPDWLVCNYNGAPVADSGLYGIKLCLEDVIGLIGFSLLESFSNAKDGLKVSGLSALDLLAYHLVSLVEELSAL